MGDHDHDVRLIASAQINASTSGIAFLTEHGFKTATRSGVGAYDLELNHDHDVEKIVVNVTRNSLLAGSIGASLPSEGHIQVNSFDGAGVAVDASFFITVWRVKD